MLNDRDDKYNPSEESEYHFTDEETGYEVEEGAPKPSEPPPPSEPKLGFLSRLSRSKRMIGALVVFLILIFVVYKMVAPTTTPSMDIKTPPATPVAMQQAAPSATPQQPVIPVTAQKAPTSNVYPTTETQPNIAISQPQQAMVSPPVAQQPTQTPTLSQPTMPTQPVTQASTVPVGAPSQVYPQQAPAEMPGQQAMSTQGQQVPPGQQAPQMQQAQQMQQVPPMQQAQQMQPGMTNATQPGNMQQMQGIPSQPTTAMPAISPTYTGAPAAYPQANVPTGLSTQSAQLINQLQSDYAQKLNDFSVQNKALQDQIQALNARVAAMESELNQLIHALTEKRHNSTMRQEPPPPPMQPIAATPRIAYSVQAIIPGRAWLKSETGETVTVAEGDIIKDLGRVTKIDPYDGIVEVNTGTKVISLSYGTTG